MKYLRSLALIVLGLSTCITVHAKSPSIDYQWAEFYGNTKSCLGFAEEALLNAGFKITYSGKRTVVGNKGNYKGVVACFISNELVIFTVAGPVYKVAERSAKDIQNSFQPAG